MYTSKYIPCTHSSRHIASAHRVAQHCRRPAGQLQHECGDVGERNQANVPEFDGGWLVDGLVDGKQIDAHPEQRRDYRDGRNHEEPNCDEQFRRWGESDAQNG